MLPTTFSNFCEANNYIGFSFDGITTTVKDTPKGYGKSYKPPTAWEKIEKTKVSKFHSGFAILTGEKSGITGFDFDDLNFYAEFLEAFPEYKDCRKTVTKSGYHLHLKYRPEIDNKNQGLIDFKNNGGMLISYPTQYKMPDGSAASYDFVDGEVMPITDQILDWLTERGISWSIDAVEDKKKPTIKKVKKVTKTVALEDTESETDVEEAEYSPKLREYFDSVDTEKIADYINWLRFTTACFILGISKKDWDTKCKFARGYNRANNLKQWGKNEKHFGEGWAWKVFQSLSNKRAELFQKHYDDISVKTFSTGVVADFFAENYGEKYIFNDKNLYFFNGVYWEQDDESFSYLTRFVDTELYLTLTNFVLDRIKDFALDDAKKEKAVTFLKSLNSLRNHNSRSSILKDICCKLARSKVEWDDNPYLFAFKNKIYDLKEGRFVKPNPDDLIRTTCGWEWNDAAQNEEKVDKVKEIVGEIFTKQEVGDYYLSALSTGLSGIQLQNLFIATGGGANGKSVLDGLMMATVGEYGYKLPSSVLLQEIKGGANPEVANIHNKRFCLAQEPDKAKKFKTSVVKELTGDDVLNSRQLYSKNCVVKLIHTLIMECNKIPKVDEINYAVQRRYRLIEFISKFVSQEEMDKFGGNVPANTFLRNTEYTTTAFKESHRQAFFILLAPYFKAFHEKGMPNQPPEVLAKQRAYFEGCDDLLGWFNDYFVPSETAKPIPLKRIYKFYTSSPFFENLPKNLKREQKQSWFVEQLGETKKDAVKQRKERYNGQQLSSDCLVGFVPNEDAKELYNWNDDEDQD